MSKPTDAELDLLQIIWKHQPCSVRMVHEILSRNKKVGYTTTLKQMQRMEEKNMIFRDPDSTEKSIQYRAVEKASTTKTKLIDKIKKKVFGNSVSELMMHAIGKEQISNEELSKIKEIIEKLEHKTRNNERN